MTVAVLGSQTPRVFCAPEHVSSAGAEVVELAAMAGLHLDPWQQLVLEHAFAERADGKLAAFEVGLIVPRQNGKGSILEALELGWLFLLNEPLILHSAHEFKTSSEAFLRIKTLIEGCDALVKRCKKPRTSHGEESIELLNGNRLRFMARTTGSGRGFTGYKVVLDEAYALQPNHMAALLPTLSSVPNPQIVYTSSAGLADSEQLKRVRQRGLDGDAGRLAYFEWSADPRADFDDREAWAQANPALGIRIDEEFVEAERSAMPDMEFGRERLGIWEDPNAGNVIDWNLWVSLTDAKSTPEGRVAFAIDTSPNRQWTSISSGGQRSDGQPHIELVEHRAGTHWVKDRVVELRDQHGPCAIVLDPGAAAGSLLPELVEAGVDVVTPTMREVGQACGAFYDAVQGGFLRHLEQEPLDDAVKGAKKRPLGDAWAWDRKNSSIDITPIVSSTLALWGWSTKHNDGDDGGWMVIL